MAKRMLEEVGKSVAKVGVDDPRRVIHSMKVGLAVTLVSSLYYFHPIYQDFGTSALWAVLTVVVVSEFSVGATLCKGLNRAMATMIGGSLAVGVHSLAIHCGIIGEPLLISIFVFLQAAVSTYARFSPMIKARYDYGFLIFILTFSFISISGFRVEEIIELARDRWDTILLGVIGSLLVSILVFPIWAGEDLHNLIANNMDALADSLQGYSHNFLKLKEISDAQVHQIDTSTLSNYKNVLNTKTAEETLANFAKWEPSHGCFRFKHPWKQYLQIGALARECAYKINALDAHLNNIHSQQMAPKFHHDITVICHRMSYEASKTLREQASALKSMCKPASSNKSTIVGSSSKHEIGCLHDMLKSSTVWDDSQLLPAIAATTIISILNDILNCAKQITDCTTQLSSLAHFKQSTQQNSQRDSILMGQEFGKEASSSTEENPRNGNKDVKCSHIAITIEAQNT